MIWMLSKEVIGENADNKDMEENDDNLYYIYDDNLHRKIFVCMHIVAGILIVR